MALVVPLVLGLVGAAEAQLTLTLWGKAGSKVVQYEASGSWTLSVAGSSVSDFASRGPLGNAAWSRLWDDDIGNVLRSDAERDFSSLSSPVIYRKNGTEFARFTLIDLEPSTTSDPAGDDVELDVVQAIDYPQAVVGDKLSWSGVGTFTLQGNFEAVFEDFSPPNNVFQRAGSAFRLVVRTDNFPALGRPNIDDLTPMVGETLTALPGTIADLDGLDTVSYAWQWEQSDPGADSGWSGISGATTSAFTVTRAQAGRRLRVKAEFTDDAGNAEGPLYSCVDPADECAGRVPDRVPNVVSIERDGGGRLSEGQDFRIDATRLGATSNRAQVHLVFRDGVADGPASAEVCRDAGGHGRISNIPFTFSADRDRYLGIERHVCDDDDPEPRESVWVVIDEGRLPQGYQADPDRGAVELAIERSDVEVSIADAEARAGEPVEFEVSLNQAIDVDVPVDYETIAGTAGSEDFTGTGGDVVIRVGATSAVFAIATTDDDDEDEETFTVTLTSHDLAAGVTIADASATGTILPNEGAKLDVDGNETVGLLTDGLLLVRYLIGARGSALTNLALAENAHEDRNEPDEIAAYLQGLVDGDVLDVDGNGTVGLLTDGLLLVRYLIDVRGPELTEGAAAGDAHEDRNEPEEIAAYLDSLMPPE